MSRKILLLLLVGVYCVAFSGLTAAEGPEMTFPNDTSMQSPADSGNGISLPDSLQLRDPAETGSVPEVPEIGSGSSDEGHSNDSKEPTEEYGNKMYHDDVDTQ